MHLRYAFVLRVGGAAEPRNVRLPEFMRDIKPSVAPLIFALCAIDMAVQPALSLLHGHRVNSGLLPTYLLIIAVVSAALLFQHKRVQRPRYQARASAGTVDFAAMVFSITLGSLPLFFGLLWGSADLHGGKSSILAEITVGVGVMTTLVGSILAIELSPKTFQKLRRTINAWEDRRKRRPA